MTFSLFEYALLWFFILLSGFSVGLFAVKGTRDFAAFAFYFGLLAGLVMAMSGALSFEDGGVKNSIFLVLISISGLLGSFWFLNVQPHNQNTRLSYGGALLTLPVIFFLPLLFDNDSTLIKFGFLGLSVFNALFCFISSKKDHMYKAYMGGAWVVVGMAALNLSAEGGMALFWGGMVLQGTVFGFAAFKKIRKLREDTIAEAEKENRMAQSLARLKQSKETADQARLLRVIERERELMGELREREMLRTQEMRKAKDIADEANRSKSAFLAVVSHEIRTPMNGVMGMLRLLKDTNMTMQQTEYLNAMQNSGDTMLALLNDILDFEKIESGNLELEMIDFDMRKIVRDVITLMSGHAVEKGLTLKSNIPEDFPPVLKADPTRLRQVLLNLVNNAIKFTAHGSVTIYLKSDYNPDHECYEIYCAVEDTGIGISEDGIKGLFMPFSQAEKSTTRKYGGTGLGLAICRRLVAAMGGEIQVNSLEGSGSTFYFTVFMKEGQVAFNENAGDISLRGDFEFEIEPMRILVVEDNEMNRRVMKGFLDKDHHQLMLVESAEDALQILETSDFDLVITDINLTGMDGMDLTKVLRASEKEALRTLPVIAVSGNVSVEDREAYRRAGFNGFVAKPVKPEDLRYAVHKLQHNDLDWPIEDRHDIERLDDEAPAIPKEARVLFSPDMLQGLIDSLPKDQFEDLVNSFLDKTDEIVGVLVGMEAEGQGQTEDMHARAHELKGMAANFGLDGVADISAKIEKLAKDRQFDQAMEMIKKLPEMNQEAQKQLTNWIESY